MTALDPDTVRILTDRVHTIRALVNGQENASKLMGHGR